MEVMLEIPDGLTEAQQRVLEDVHTILKAQVLGMLMQQADIPKHIALITNLNSQSMHEKCKENGTLSDEGNAAFVVAMDDFVRDYDLSGAMKDFLLDPTIAPLEFPCVISLEEESMDAFFLLNIVPVCEGAKGRPS